MWKILTVGGVTLILIIGMVSWRSSRSAHLDIPVGMSISPALAQRTEAREAPERWREYRNDTYHFSLFYPQELTTSEHVEGGGAMTITFQNPEKGIGFQLFIVPYGEQKVSEARFKQDIPSGVRTDLHDVTIDGAVGAVFYSTDISVGDTHEIWFISGGYLYEVTTLRPLDQWMQSIMQTWRFI